MQNYGDVLIRIGGAVSDSDSRFPVEAWIDGAGPWRGESSFDFDKLDPGALSKEEYGKMLGQQLLNPSVARALEQAGAGQGKRVRIRLLVDKEVSAPHWIRWERIYLPIGGAFWPVAISPDVPFSRYIPDERPDADPPSDTVFRLLFAVSNPSDLPADKLLDVESEIDNLLTEFAGAVPTARFQVRILPGRTGLSDSLKLRLAAAKWEIAEGNATLDNISKCLHRGFGCHALHILCHGNFKRGGGDANAGTGILFLEDDQGEVAPAKDFELQSWIHPKLQLIVFQACRTAALVSQGEPPFAGIAPKVVSFGVPAVIGMQDFVLMTEARKFAAAFYRALLRDGFVDQAVNEGRQAMRASGESVDFSIPALFMRLKGARLWRADPVREDVWNTKERIGVQPDPLPLKVVQHARGLVYDPVQGPQGPLYDLTNRTEELLHTEWMTCLAGPPGFDKTAQVYVQYERLAKAYLNGSSDVAPVMLSISELDQWGRFRSGPTPGDFRGNLQSVASRGAAPAELSGREFVFLVEADQALSEEATRQAVDSLLRLLKVFTNSRALIVYEETSLSNLKEQLAATADGSSAVNRVQLLVVRPMQWPDLRRFLMGHDEDPLAQVIEERQLTDLASAPWILARLREFAGLGRFPSGRADALGLIASSYLINFDLKLGPRVCAEQALERIAWQLQIDRTCSLDSNELLKIVIDVRGQRDFRVSELLQGLIKCKILEPSGEEGVRFAYRALQAYYAARYVQKSPRKLAELEDITATLGRYSRIRHWQDVLITLAGLQRTLDERVQLLQAILAGSSLAEGEQGFLAVSMYMEMADTKVDPKTREVSRVFSPNLQDDKVVKQILDALIWRSRPDMPRPYADRRVAVERLAEMRHPDAIQHLVSLAVGTFSITSLSRKTDEEAAGALPSAQGGSNKYDNSGIRLIAVNGLLLQAENTMKYVAEGHPEFKPVIDAWLAMFDHKNIEPMVEILKRNDPAFSPVAVFALAQAGMELGGPPLLEICFSFERAEAGAATPDPEVLWAITEVFSAQEADWLYAHVICRWLHANRWPDRRVCYLIQRLGQARPEVVDYLYSCLREERMNTHDRALRAFSKLNNVDANDWLLPMCHNIVEGNWEEILQSPNFGLKEEPHERDAWRLQQAALEVLRDIATSEDTIAVIRDARLKMEPVLFQLSFQVAEEIYWRVTGGLASESFDSKKTLASI